VANHVKAWGAKLKGLTGSDIDVVCRSQPAALIKDETWHL